LAVTLAVESTTNATSPFEVVTVSVLLAASNFETVPVAVIAVALAGLAGLASAALAARLRGGRLACERYAGQRNHRDSHCRHFRTS
jgi:hypothetical protein